MAYARWNRLSRTILANVTGSPGVLPNCSERQPTVRF